MENRYEVAIGGERSNIFVVKDKVTGELMMLVPTIVRLNDLTAELNRANKLLELTGAEVERLDSENQRLRAELSGNNAAWDMLEEAGMGGE